MVVRAYVPRSLRINRRLDPLLTAARLASAGLFDSYVVYERNGSWSFAGGTVGTVILRRDTVTASWQGADQRVGTEPLRQVAHLLEQAPYRRWRAYGWAAFELAYALHGRNHLIAETESNEPLLFLAVPQVEVILREDGALLSATSDALLTECRDIILKSTAEGDYWPKSLEVDEPDDNYRRIVTDTVAELQRRLLSKVILSRTIPVDFDVDLAATYVLGRQRNNPARSFLLNLGGVEAAGFSPETVVEVDRGGLVSTQPLAGTRALTEADQDNLRLRTELLRDPKEIFEHAISVKVAYDELVDLCGPGPVRVEDFMSVRERGSVQHLASRVTGQLPEGRDQWDAFAALFPAVTASGAPKPAALDRIHRYEQPRGLYSGAVLTVDSTGELDAALVLRAIYRKAGRTWLRAGAGIVEHSSPDREHEETCEKLRSVARHLVPAASTLGPSGGDLT